MAKKSVTALITGASSGLGAEFAWQLAGRGADLVLVARDGGALESFAERIRARHGVAVEVLVADLVDPDGLDAVAARVGDPRHPIEVLVNNAGFGLDLDFAANEIADEERHLDLHVRAPMRLTHAALGAMLARGSGRVINVASVAAFMPRGTYGAVKSWVVSFSRWANARYGPRGVTVTAVCPGFTYTNFHERMGLAPGREGVPGFLWLRAASVVREGLRDAARGKPVSIPSVRYKLMVAAVRVLPTGWPLGWPPPAGDGDRKTGRRLDTPLTSPARRRVVHVLGISVMSQVRIGGVGVVDFIIGACLILEADGGTHDGPTRHADRMRDAAAMALGFVTLRFDAAMIIHDWESVEAAILSAVGRNLHRSAAGLRAEK